MLAIAAPDSSNLRPVPLSLAKGLFELDTVLVSVARGDPLYDRACRFSAREYRRHFDCELRDFYPAYFCLSKGSRLLAVCGYRVGNEALFLEQYLDQPIENLLDAGRACPIPRQAIVEIGGFALRGHAVALPFMVRLAPAFRALGFSHAVCTATLPIRRCLRSLGVPTQVLGRADPSRLAHSSSNWGKYYAMRPSVISGSIDSAMDRIEALEQVGLAP
jgi:hypothetical protein